MRRTAALLTALACLAGTAVAAAKPGSPVQLNSCGLMYDNTHSLSAQVSGLDVQFTNNSTKIARVVNVKADINGTKQVIRDVGTFSPGVEIHHRYRVATGQFALPMVLSSIFGGRPSVQCSIDSVEFADGSTWPGHGSAGTGASKGQNPYAITVTPSNLVLHGAGVNNARLVLASGGGSLALNSNCGSVATVEVLATTAYDLALRVTPKAAGSCTLTIHDVNDNVATVSVTAGP